MRMKWKENFSDRNGKNDNIESEGGKEGWGKLGTLIEGSMKLKTIALEMRFAR